jgi:hypothetical protein
MGAELRPRILNQVVNAAPERRSSTSLARDRCSLLHLPFAFCERQVDWHMNSDVAMEVSSPAVKNAGVRDDAVLEVG